MIARRNGPGGSIRAFASTLRPGHPRWPVHKGKIAADNFDGPRLGSLPKRLKERPIHGVFFDAVYHRIGVKIHKARRRHSQRSHEFFSSRRNSSYSSQVLKARGPGGSDCRNSNAERNCGAGFSGAMTMTSTLA